MEGGWKRATGMLVVLLLASVAWGVWQWRERVRAEALQSAQYQRALFELIAQAEQTELLLAKALAAGTDQQRALILTDVWRQAFGAQANLNQLPVGSAVLLRTSQLFTQTGDYAYMLARKAAQGQPLSGEERRTLADLRRQVALVVEQLHQVVEAAARGSMTWREMQRLTRGNLDDVPNQFRDGFARLDTQLVSFPTLIYDGPFSDHIQQREPKGLTGEVIDAEAAQRIALEFLPYSLTREDVFVRGQVEGPIPSYSIRVTRREGFIDLDVSRKGGHVVWMLDSRPVEQTRLTVDEAIQRAREFLAQRGLADMTPTWASSAAHRLVVPFAYVQDGIVVYPDLIKVTVALDNGDIIGYEAMGYLMSHHTRKLPAPVLTEADARARLNPALEVGDGRLALIPLETLEEVLAWEFPARLDGESYLLYINALTGNEERILKLLSTSAGTLVL